MPGLERFKWDEPKEDAATYVERVKRLRATAYKHELYAVALHLAYVGWDRERFLAAAGEAWDAAMGRDEQVRKQLESEAVLKKQFADSMSQTPETVRQQFDQVTQVCAVLNEHLPAACNHGHLNCEVCNWVGGHPGELMVPRGPISAGKWDK